jgi:hypothetical protein
LGHFSKQSISLLSHIFWAALVTHHITQEWKHAQVIHILQQGKDPGRPSSYRPFGFLDTISKLIEIILIGSILHGVSERGLMRDK